MHLPRYEACPRDSSGADCEAAVRSALGRDLRRPAFRAPAVAACEEPVWAFEALAHQATP